jgi:hypothetical protein
VGGAVRATIFGSYMKQVPCKPAVFSCFARWALNYWMLTALKTQRSRKKKWTFTPLCHVDQTPTKSLFDSNGVKATVSKKHNFKYGVSMRFTL